MNSKCPVVFFSAGVILILMMFLAGVPMNVAPASSQDPIDKTNLEMLLKDDEDSQPTEGIPIQTEIKSIDQMDCAELNEFIMSFEKGWGNAVALHDEKCS